jgi:hypothetical protein
VKTVTRERFVGHFSITLQVKCLSMWSKRQKEAPTFLSQSIFDEITTCNGEIAIASARAFADIVDPVIVELHRLTPKGLKPDAADLTARVYDALDAAGVEVTIGPPLEAHGHRPPGRGSRV